MGITLSVPGNHAFDDGQEAFARKWADSDYLPRRWDFRYVCANMRREGRIPDSCQPWAVVPVPFGDGDTVKVAFDITHAHFFDKETEKCIAH